MPNQNQNPGNFANNPARAAEAGRRGGQMSAGNFANNPERAAIAGRKGGKASSGNFANNPERAAEAGRRGGLNSHGSRERSATDTGGLNATSRNNRAQEGGFTTPAGRNNLDRDEY